MSDNTIEPEAYSTAKDLQFITHVYYSSSLYTLSRFGNLKLVVILYVSLFLCVIDSHSIENFRCSHKPPAPEEINLVWVDSANFSVSEDNSNGHGLTTGAFGTSSRKKKRQIDLVNEISRANSDMQDYLNLIRRFERKKQSDARNELVPMKIQVYYDSSVYLLEKNKRDLINKTVMPAVVEYFGNVLSIRRDFTIDKFRISRRCPSNTIYYARDLHGYFRPYCKERCENYAVCGEMIVPPEHLSACSYCNSTSKRCTTNLSSEGQGVANTQLLLYVSANQTARCRKDQTIAYAAHCAQDAKTDRPVAGHANLCPSSISTDQKDLRALIATVKHELTHVLGFSVSLFAYYRDQNGLPLTERDSSTGPIPVDPTTGYSRWSDKVIKKFTRSNWLTGEGKIEKQVHLVVTPTVVKEVRKHFNCSTLEGAELEDQGSDGTSMTHWEKRLFENEAMTGTHTQNSVYSRLTLAVLQDTGWYVANFSRADELEWGKNLGCNFAQKSCKSWIDERRVMNQSIRPFCDRVKGDILQIACTEDRASKAVCNMRQYKEPLPSAYQNFDHLDGVPKSSVGYFGGSVDLADYCPFIQEFTWQAQNVTVRGSRCDHGGNSVEPERNAALEHYGPQTKCFEHGRIWEQRSCIYKRHWHHYGAGCYKFTCHNGHVNVQIGNQSHACFYPDQLIHIEQVVDNWLYNGTLLCPACDKVCPAHKCVTHNRSLIDKILELSQDTMGFSHSSLEDVLDAFLEDSTNLIQTNHLFKTFNKSKIQSSESNNSTSSIERLKYRLHLSQLFSSYKPTPREQLVCSGATAIVCMVHIVVVLSSLQSMYFAYRRVLISY